ncbi:MAG TPA: NUDIX domain-containing protein, partial [Sphingomicrobium sp.]
RVAVVDTNVTRVVARLHAIAAPVRSRIGALVLEMSPAERPGDFAQAMMDLGATVCRPQAPLCAGCPLRADCRAYALGRTEAYPAPKAKSARPVRHGIAYWIERDGHVWLVRRPDRGLLGGMAALPGPDWTAELPPAGSPTVAAVSHVFTHFRLELALERRAEPIGEGWWQPLDRLAEAGLPTLYRKAAAALLADDQRLAA